MARLHHVKSWKMDKQKVISLLSKLWRGLTEPHVSVLDPEQRRLARTLAALQLALVLVGAAATMLISSLSYETLNPRQNPFIMLGGGALLAGMVIYGLSRSRRYFLGAGLGIGVIWLVIFLTVQVEPETSLLPAFLTIPLMGSLLFFKQRATLVVFIISMGAVLLVPLLNPGISWYVSVMAAEYILISGIMIITVANMRQGDFKRIQAQMAEIQILNDFLQHDIAESGVQLDKTNAFLARVLAASPAVIYVAEATGSYGGKFFSDNVKMLLGHKPSDFIEEATFWKRNVHPEDLERVIAETSNLYEHDTHMQEYRFRCQDGSYLWLHDEMNLIRDADGAPLEMIGSWFDITQLKQSEASLASSLEQTTRAQKLLLMLSQASQAVQRAHTEDEVYSVVGSEIYKLGCNTVVLVLTPDGKNLNVPYYNFNSEAVQAVEKLTGLSSKKLFSAPLKEGGVYQRMITANEIIYFESLTPIIPELLPAILRPLAGQIASLLRIKTCIGAPLMVNGEPYGVLIITGSDLVESDLPAYSAFANQMEGALENARLYQRMQAQADEKEILLREVHHRVKNNLQIIASLLRIQARGFKDGETKNAFDRIRQRVASMALVHEKLYRSDDLSEVDFCDYLKSMAYHLVQTYSNDPDNMRLVFDCPDVIYLDLNTAILSGMIANELVSNALQHAFPAGGGELRIACHVDPHGYCMMSVANDGPPPLLARSQDGGGFGLNLVEMLAAQLKGTLDIQHEPEVRFGVKWRVGGGGQDAGQHDKETRKSRPTDLRMSTE